MVEPGFCYNSGTNAEWLTSSDIQHLIKTKLDPNFSPL